MRSLMFVIISTIFLANCRGEREAEPQPRPVGTTAGVNELYLEAVRQGNLAEVRRYLEQRGARVRAQDSLGNNALALAARSEQAQPSLVRYVYDHMPKDPAQPAAVDVPDNRGRTPLSWAAGNGRGDLLALYLEWGARVDRSDEFELYTAALRRRRGRGRYSETTHHGGRRRERPGPALRDAAVCGEP